MTISPDQTPICKLDESDEESDLKRKSEESGPSQEKIARTDAVSPLNDIEKILDHEMRPTASIDSDASKLGSSQVLTNQYLVKWKGLSYLHCTWVPEDKFGKAYNENPRLKRKVNRFHRQLSNYFEDEFVAIKSDWTTIDRIIASRGVEEGEKEYLVKWKDLPYDECYWELESDIKSFQNEIDRFNQIESRLDKIFTAKQKTNKDFQPYEETPNFLPGGSLHLYQLEALNFVRFAWSKQRHVILADETGLGKTKQSIAFLASLFDENLSPHLVIAPLSELRNWELEFALCAPHMNVVTYVGNSQARAVIREYEFYYLKNQNKSKKKKSDQSFGETKQDRIKFDVLLTSYEVIDTDSTTLTDINWECMIVDEGNCLKNKDSKLFSSLKQYLSRHQILLTATPLQDNLDELFMLMHFLDAGKFESLQEELKDINQEEQVSRLHKMLEPHFLRRVKKDVLKELPPKKELILRVELSTKQKEYYKAVLTRNYQILTQKGGTQISLINLAMELRKLCCHPFMLEPAELDDYNKYNKQLLESSGKLQLLDKILIKLKEQGHRVLIYSQFRHMLDLLEDYCTFKNWRYERIDGKVGGAEREARIDLFNSKNSSRFCFLLSTRTGGLGINLDTADTIIIYDSDWNPHAHRFGRRNKVMIYRLIARGSIEERVMQMTKKKKIQNLNQEELDDIIRYGSKELFDDESGKSCQIHYDDMAINRLLDRERIADEEASLDNDDEVGLLKAEKVANFEYVDEANFASEEEASVSPAEDKTSIDNPERARYWENLLRDKCKEEKIEEVNAIGKGKRKRKQMVSVEEDLACLEDSISAPDRKRACGGDALESLPLMEGEGRSFRVLGFNQIQRGVFVQILMRFGLGNFDWAAFIPRLNQKTYGEIHNYGSLFLAHIAEEITDLPTFSDGVPKEGLRIQDVLVRIATLTLIRDKVKSLPHDVGGSTLFSDDIISRYPELRGGSIWKENHNQLLLRAILKHGYGKWQNIVDDKEWRLQEVISQVLNFTSIETIDKPQTQTMICDFRETRRRQVEFIKRRVILLEKGLHAELQKEFLGVEKMGDLPNGETGIKAVNVKDPISKESDTQMIDPLPQLEIISPEEISLIACDNKSDRLEMARLYNEMVRVLEHNSQNIAEEHLANKPAENSNKSIKDLQNFIEMMNHILSPIHSQTSKDDQNTAQHLTDNNAAIRVNNDTNSNPSAMDTDDDPIKIEIETDKIPVSKESSDGTVDVEMDEKPENNAVFLD